MLMQTERLPWHAAQWSNVARALATDQFPHALLLYGPEGVGKVQFMHALAQSLVCADVVITKNELTACAKCRPCEQFGENAEHADIKVLRLEEGDREIKIDKARAVIDFANLASHYGGRKLVLVQNAERLNHNAANALLKTLEEPPPGTVLILSTSQPARLMPTIRSRCQQIRFSLPARDESLKWLLYKGISDPDVLIDEVNGAPLKALLMEGENIGSWRRDRDKELRQFIQDRRSPSRLAKHWLQFDAMQIHAWLFDRVKRIHWFKSGVGTALVMPPELKDVASSLNLGDGAEIQQRLNSYRSTDINNINKQLSLESILIYLSDNSD